MLTFSGPAGRRLALAVVSMITFSIRAEAGQDSIKESLISVTNQAWAGQTPGIQVGLWVPGHGEWKIALGLADIKRNLPMRIGMQQPIGSITKTMTASLILQLVEEGKLSLDDRLSKWYPSAPEGDQITVAMLLNMTSGIADYLQGYFFRSFPETLVRNPHFIFQHELIASYGLSLPRVFQDPGSEDAYSNTNTILLGEIAEKVTGKRYERLLSERLFRPLGMRRTFLAQRGGLRAPFTHLYYADEVSDRLIDTTQWSTSEAWAAGGVASTLEDAHRWAIALGTGRGILGSRMQTLRGESCGPEINGNDPDSSARYCLGVIVMRDRRSGRITSYSHTGAIFGAQAFLSYDTKRGAVVVVLANGSSLDTSVATRTFEKIVDALPQFFSH